MTGVVERLAGWLVEPAARARPAAPPPALRAPSLALLAGPREAPALGAALALRATTGIAVLGVWTGEEPAPAGGGDGPALPGARRLARSLRARELPAAAIGRLVTVALPAGAAAAATAAGRLEGALSDEPLTLAVAGPRDAGWDRFLALRDVVLVHATEPLLGELTVERLVEQGIAARPLEAVPSTAARLLARAGLALPGPGAGPLVEAVST